MSSTNRGSKRSPADYYPTPAWCVHRLLEEVEVEMPWEEKMPWSIWMDPCAGDGAIIRAVNDFREPPTPRRWIANDIRPECLPSLPSGSTSEDFLAGPVPAWAEGADVVITNPPYALAAEFIRRSLFEVRASFVAMLLGLNFLASKDRVALWTEVQVPDIFVLPNRPDFSGGGGDSCEYAWFVWHSRMTGCVRILGTTPKEVRAAQKPKLAAQEA